MIKITLEAANIAALKQEVIDLASILILSEQLGKEPPVLEGLEPPVTQPAPTPAPAPQPEPEPEPAQQMAFPTATAAAPKPAVTQQELSQKAVQLIDKLGSNAPLVQLLQAYGAGAITQLKQDQLPAFMAEVEKLLEAS